MITQDFKRYLYQKVSQDLEKKMVFVAGPRQVGKTTLSEMILSNSGAGLYLNWDYQEDRDKILKNLWPSGKQVLVLDEIHKYRQWRNTLKGLYDKRKNELSILVTGSARLDYYRRGGDSLQGRYYFHRLHPLSVAELGLRTIQELEDLQNLSGFPEPYFSKSIEERNRWALQYRSLLIRQDLVDLENVLEIDRIEQLAIRLPDLVGSPLSLKSISEDLQVSQPTIKRWCDILERLYYIFRIYPFGAPKLKAVKKQAKHYHFDWALPSERGARLENLLAGHLLKWCHFEYDSRGRELELRYFRDLRGQEVDFVVCEKSKPILFIECKWSHKKSSNTLAMLKNKFPKARAVQLFNREEDSKEHYVDARGIEHLSLIGFLRGLV